MIQMSAVLLAVFISVIAGNVMGNQDARPFGRRTLGHGVVGGGGCNDYKFYADSKCTQEVSWVESNWTVGISVEDGCYDLFPTTSESDYCDVAGYHRVRFDSSSDCTGDGVEWEFYPNGCSYAYWDMYKFTSCTMNGPCDGGGVKSTE
mmetsp:Transcript_65589/g.77671  ORF Transcript_65589/g.77671 Transcript_65589/m.77671 type:complete len:148 (-) Transcript_65589:124-567(-)